jgi:hypothetical protein
VDGAIQQDVIIAQMHPLSHNDDICSGMTILNCNLDAIVPSGKYCDGLKPLASTPMTDKRDSELALRSGLVTCPRERISAFVDIARVSKSSTLGVRDAKMQS